MEIYLVIINEVPAAAFETRESAERYVYEWEGKLLLAGYEAYMEIKPIDLER